MLPIVTDGEELSSVQRRTILSVGNTAYLQSSGVDTEISALGQDGGKIVTVGKRIYLFGGSDQGTQYAVYEFLRMLLGFEQYTIGRYDLDIVTELSLPQYDETFAPDIAMRWRGAGTLGLWSDDLSERQFGERLGMGSNCFSNIMPIHSDYTAMSACKQVHNTMYYLPYETYAEEHSSWYSQYQSYGAHYQLCYTAHGNAAEWELMAQECAKKIQYSLSLYTPSAYPEYNAVSLTIEDGLVSCSCSACTNLYERYGTYAAGAIVFVNRVSELVDEWMENEENAAYRRSDFRILFFAYQDMETAPVRYDEATGKYEAIDLAVQPKEGVSVLLTMNDICYQQSIYAEINASARSNIEGWAALCDEIYFWTYSTNFDYYFYFFDTFDFYTGEWYEYVLKNNGICVFNQQQFDCCDYANGHSSGTLTAWHDLKAYLDARLSWDTSLDYDALVDGYFNAVYKDAAPVMRALFEEQRAAYRAVVLADGTRLNEWIGTTVSLSKAENRYYTADTLFSWLQDFEAALAAVEKYRESDPTLYQTVSDRIYAEWLSPAYILLEVYGEEETVWTAEEKAELIEEFKAVLLRIDPERKMKNKTGAKDTLYAFVDGL